MKCTSITISLLATGQGGEPKYLGHNGEGDNRIILWSMPSGEQIISTNGDVVGESDEGFAEMRRQILGQCPHCGAELSEAAIRDLAAASDLKVTTHRMGRPRIDAPRCQCGANTLARATARRFDCCRRSGIKPQRNSHE